MPPERSRWARTPSSRAIEVAAAAESPQKKLATSTPDDAGAQMTASSTTSAVGQVPLKHVKAWLRGQIQEK